MYIAPSADYFLTDSSPMLLHRRTEKQKDTSRQIIFEKKVVDLCYEIRFYAYDK